MLFDFSELKFEAMRPHFHRKCLLKHWKHTHYIGRTFKWAFSMFSLTSLLTNFKNGWKKKSGWNAIFMGLIYIAK